MALGRIASYSDDLAEAVVENDILPQLVYSLGEQNVSLSSGFVWALFPYRETCRLHQLAATWPIARCFCMHPDASQSLLPRSLLLSLQR